MRALIVLLLVAMLTGCAGSGTGPGTVAEQVAAATTAWQVAYDSRDAARIVALYDAEAVLWGTVSKTIAASPAAVAGYFKDAATRPTARVVIGEQHVRVFGDTAVNSGTYTFSEIRDGQPISRPARFTFVFRHRDGRWQVVAHHSSLLP